MKVNAVLKVTLDKEVHWDRLDQVVLEVLMEHPDLMVLLDHPELRVLPDTRDLLV